MEEEKSILKISATLGKVDVLKSKNELQSGDNYLILTAYQSDTDKLMDYLKKLENLFGVSFTIAKDIDLYNNDKYTSFYCKVNQDNINKISEYIYDYNNDSKITLLTNTYSLNNYISDFINRIKNYKIYKVNKPDEEEDSVSYYLHDFNNVKFLVITYMDQVTYIYIDRFVKVNELELSKFQHVDKSIYENVDEDTEMLVQHLKNNVAETVPYPIVSELFGL